MFLTYKKGMKLDGNNPTLLYGYGGFNVNNSPGFSALRIALLEQGVVYASANMRGGGEYGEKWHEAGTKLKKQNVFDDFIAAAEWLIKNKYTSSNKTGDSGRVKRRFAGRRRRESASGPVPGRAPARRRDGHAALPQVHDRLELGGGLRLERANAAEFKALYAYSPIHNIKPGTKYPAVLITTADHDDRVVPAHSFKYAAAMQAAQGGDNPIVIRIDTKSGHGASSTTKALGTERGHLTRSCSTTSASRRSCKNERARATSVSRNANGVQ